jgi:hypothetical protein
MTTFLGVFYQPGTVIFKLTRTGPNTYEGQILETDDHIDRVWRPVWLQTTIRVEKDFMCQSGRGRWMYNYPDASSSNTFVWVRRSVVR